MVKLKNKCVNWVQNLPNCMRVLNELAQDELGWQSPFEVYYGRKSSFVVKASYNTNKTITCMPTSSEPTSINVLQNRSKRIKKIRSEAVENTKRLGKRMVDKHKKRHKTMEYKYNDKVLIRIGNGGKRSHPKRRFVMEGTILKKGKHSDNYKVLLIPPGQTNFTEQWVSIEDIASTKHTNKTNSCRKSHRSKYLIPLTGENQLEVFEDQSYTIAYNPSIDGDCQFSALSYFFQRIGVYRSANIIRQEIVQYLSENPNNSERQPLEYFTGLPWPRYLHNMALSGTYGDHITLQAASNLYNTKIEIASSLGHHARTMIQPQEYEPITRF